MGRVRARRERPHECCPSFGSSQDPGLSTRFEAFSLLRRAAEFADVSLFLWGHVVPRPPASPLGHLVIPAAAPPNRHCRRHRPLDPNATLLTSAILTSGPGATRRGFRSAPAVTQPATRPARPASPPGRPTPSGPLPAGHFLIFAVSAKAPAGARQMNDCDLMISFGAPLLGVGMPQDHACKGRQ